MRASRRINTWLGFGSGRQERSGQQTLGATAFEEVNARGGTAAAANTELVHGFEREAVAASIPLNQINARLVHRVVTLLRRLVVFMKLERRKNPAGSGGRTLLESLRSSTVGGGYSVVRCSVPRRRLRSGRPAERIAGTCSKLHSAILSILLRAVRIHMDSTCSAIHGRLSARNAGEHEAGAHRRRNQ